MCLFCGCCSAAGNYVGDSWLPLRQLQVARCGWGEGGRSCGRGITPTSFGIHCKNCYCLLRCVLCCSNFDLCFAFTIHYFGYTWGLVSEYCTPSFKLVKQLWSYLEFEYSKDLMLYLTLEDTSSDWTKLNLIPVEFVTLCTILFNPEGVLDARISHKTTKDSRERGVNMYVVICWCPF